MKARTLLALWFAGLPLLAQERSAPEQAAPVVAPVRLHIIGASVSAGFEDGPLFGAEKQGDSVPLQTMFKAWADDLGKVSTHSPTEMAVMFREPVPVAEREIALLKKRKPDVVLAVDFLFWFAYGYVGEDEAKERRELLAQGLAMLTKLDLPVVVGDLPDMTGAARRMLNPRQIPSPDVLKALNTQLHEAVQKNPKLHLVPLAGFVTAMRGEGLALPLEGGPLTTSPGAMLQEDRLHATRLGVAYLCYVVQAQLQKAMPEGHPLRERNWTFEQFVEAAGAQDELEGLRQPAAGADKEGR